MGKVVSRNVAYVTNANANLDKYLIMKFSYLDNESNYETKDVVVNIFKNREYKINFYNANKQTYESLTGLVLDFSGTESAPAIILKYFEKAERKDNECCPTHDHSTCDCILADDKAKDKYTRTTCITIPAFNINSITYMGPTTCTTMPDNPPKPTIKKKGVRYLLLGINAEIVTLMMVNLDFIDDRFENAFKSINLKIGGIYKIVYSENNGDHCHNTIYEIEGTLVNIEEVPNKNNNSSCIMRMNKCDHPEEIVGVHNSIYCACDVSTDKDKFLTGEGCDMDIKLTFDTMSSPINGSYDILYLSQIRDVEVIDDNVDERPNHNRPCHDSHHHDHHDKKKSYVVNGVTYIFDNDKVYYLDKDGLYRPDQECTMEELINFYFNT